MRLALLFTISAMLATPSLAEDDWDGNRGGPNCKPPHNCTER